MAATTTPTKAGEMEKLSSDQLKSLKEQSDLEANLLQDSLLKLRAAATRLELASSSIHELSLRPHGKKMLVPLTVSLYVPGALDDADKVLVDVGTGYFIELGGFELSLDAGFIITFISVGDHKNL